MSRAARKTASRLPWQVSAGQTEQGQGLLAGEQGEIQTPCVLGPYVPSGLELVVTAHFVHRGVVPSIELQTQEGETVVMLGVGPHTPLVQHENWLRLG